MELLVALIVGAIVGYVASRLSGRDSGLIASVLIGVAGAFVGNLISRAVGAGNQAGLGFDWSQVLWSLGGALLVVFILNLVQKRNKGL